MLNSVKTLKEYRLTSLDGEIGSTEDFYFDDQYWAVRYLIVNSGTWLSGRHVLISPYALVSVDPAANHIDIGLTKKQIEDSPALDSEKPVSQQFERDYYDYYGWPLYYNGSYMWGTYPQIVRDRENWKESVPSEKLWDPHLRSIKEVSGYHIHAKDGDIGHIVDFVLDDETWAIRYLVIDTRNWWSGKKVLISPQWIESIIWSESKVYLSLSREIIRQSPEYSEENLLTRDYETELYRHYERRGYWAKEPDQKVVNP